MDKTKIKSQSSAQINWDKTKRDLALIRSLQQFSDSNNWRIIVYGGYGLDILLGQITRTHNDVDIVIYGQNIRDESRIKISTFLTNLIPNSTTKLSENDFMLNIDLHSPGLGANIYYVQTLSDPYVTVSTVIKQNGEQITNSPERFPEPLKGKLGELDIEVQNPQSHLADILFKQRTLTHKSSHDLDIANLRQITDAKVVDVIISLS